jgi:hypothetical protein
MSHTKTQKFASDNASSSTTRFATSAGGRSAQRPSSIEDKAASKSLKRTLSTSNTTNADQSFGVRAASTSLSASSQQTTGSTSTGTIGGHARSNDDDDDNDGVEIVRAKRVRLAVDGDNDDGGAKARLRRQVKAIKSFLDHPRLKCIAASSVFGGYVLTDADGSQIKCCGITRILEQLFYPDYDYKEALRSAPIPARFKLRTGLTRPGQGQKRGRLVHDQVRVLINGGEEAREAMFGSQRSHNAENFIRSMQVKGLQPLVAEYPIAVKELRMATEIDTICVTSKETGQKISLIELKNFSNGFVHSNGKLRNLPRLAEWSNCPLHQAFLQLALERYIFAWQNPRVVLGSCYVVQETETFSKYFKLPAKVIRASAQIFECIAAHRMAQLEKN